MIIGIDPAKEESQMAVIRIEQRQVTGSWVFANEQVCETCEKIKKLKEVNTPRHWHKIVKRMYVTSNES